jgi:hypothetical protein
MSEVVKKEYLSSFSLWGESLKLLKKIIIPALKLSSVSFFLPLVIFSFLFSYLSSEVSYSLSSLGGADVAQDITSFLTQVVSLASGFVTYYLFFLLLLAVLGVVTYFVFVDFCLSVHLDNKEISTAKSLKKVRPLILKGIVVYLGLVLLSFEQVFFGPFRIFVLLGLMAVVLLFREKTGAVQSLWHGITLKYIGQIPGRGLSVFLVVLMTAILINLYESLVASGIYYLLHLDEILNISNFLWTYTLPGFPCTLMYLFSRSLIFFSTIMLLLFISCFSVCLYTKVRKPLSERI